MRVVIFVSFVLLGGVTSLLAPLIDVSGKPPYSTPLAVTTNDVVHIVVPSGERALIRFTGFYERGASYRWRGRSSASRTVRAGAGTVHESHDSTLRLDGRYQVTRRPDHDTVVQAGDVGIEWSFGGLTNGWIYYDTNRATVRLLTLDAFEKDL